MPRDNEDQLEAAMGAAKRMKAAHGMGYKTGRLCELLYKSAFPRPQTFVWLTLSALQRRRQHHGLYVQARRHQIFLLAASEGYRDGKPHVRTDSPEISFLSQYGFLIPPEWIRPVGEETAQLVTYLAHFVARQRQLPDAP